MRQDEPKQECIEALRASRPDVAITVTREEDPYFVWDGDGPDPIENGFEPCNVTVTASTIHHGELIQGKSTLGGSYFEPDEPCADIHGYLPQMVEEAVEELDAELQRLADNLGA